MYGLWRAIVFFFLPGMVLSGWALNGAYRSWDWTDDALLMLLIYAGAGALGFTAGALWINLGNKLKSLHKVQLSYNFNVFGLFCALILLPGLVRLCGGIGWGEGLIEIICIGWFGAGIVNAFRERLLWNWWETAFFFLGAPAAWLMLFYLAGIRKLSFFEIGIFWITEAALLMWLIASPLTRRGSRKRRWGYRVTMLAVMITGVYLAPRFLFAPGGNAPLTDGEWSSTWLSGNGVRYFWSNQAGDDGWFTPAGRLIMPRETDSGYQTAIPGLLGILNGADAQVLCVSTVGSVLPEILVRNMPEGRVHCWDVPESMDAVTAPQKAAFRRQLNKSRLKAEDDLIIISALPEHQYWPRIKDFMDTLPLAESGVIALPGTWLLKAEMFDYMYGRFSYRSLLPGYPAVWVFSNRPLAADAASIDRNLAKHFPENDMVLPGTYRMLFETPDWLFKGQRYNEPPLENLRFGDYDWMKKGGWRWYLAILVSVIGYRLVRMYLERRGSAYRLWNSLENGFGWMLINLLISGWCLVHCPINNLLLAAPLMLLVLLPGVNTSRYLNILIGLTVVILGIILTQYQYWGLMLGIGLNNLYTGWFAGNLRPDFKLGQRFLLAEGAGMTAAVGLMTICWYYQAPLWGLVIIAAAVRLPGLWQNRNMRG